MVMLLSDEGVAQVVGDWVQRVESSSAVWDDIIFYSGGVAVMLVMVVLMAVVVFSTRGNYR